MKKLFGDLWRDYCIARLLTRRGWIRERDWIIRRNSDGRLFAPGSPQNFVYAMRDLWTRRRCSFHFYRVREWQGLLIASRKVFWEPASEIEFELLFKSTRFDLRPWPEEVECLKIDLARKKAAAA